MDPRRIHLNGKASGANTQLYLDGVQTANPGRVNGNGAPVSDSGNLFTIGNRPQNNSSYFRASSMISGFGTASFCPTKKHVYESPSFLTDANFTKAIDLWFSDQADEAATYGHICDCRQRCDEHERGFQGPNDFQRGHWCLGC